MKLMVIFYQFRQPVCTESGIPGVNFIGFRVQQRIVKVQSTGRFHFFFEKIRAECLKISLKL